MKQVVTDEWLWKETDDCLKGLEQYVELKSHVKARTEIFNALRYTRDQIRNDVITALSEWEGADHVTPDMLLGKIRLLFPGTDRAAE